MNSIVRFLLLHNQLLLSTINELLLFITHYIKLPKDNSIYSPKYRKFTVDNPPVIEKLELLDYKVLLKEYKLKYKEQLPPIKRRKDCIPVSNTSKCPKCGAPHSYLYINNGISGQFRCKICQHTFKPNASYNTTRIRCPYCNRILDLRRSGKHFNLHLCTNHQCSYYLTSMKSLKKSKDNYEDYLINPSSFKLRYIYREFTTNFFKIKLNSLPSSSTTLNFRKFSPHILGLVLSYSVNCGLSTRKTALVLREIHSVPISHTMVSNYVRTAAAIVKPFVDNFNYNPSTMLAADETYVKVKGVTAYVWIVMDALSKSIIGYSTSFTRDIEPCMFALRLAFSKFADVSNTKIKLIADGYPVYKLAHQIFAENNINFELLQVIGLSNDNETSTEYRWLKQIIERLNRTFKYSYKVTNGYGSSHGANAHISLFVAYYNFLRPHNSQRHNYLNSLPSIAKAPNMPAKWHSLLKDSLDYIYANS